jgi:hypothetical protein
MVASDASKGQADGRRGDDYAFDPFALLRFCQVVIWRGN